MIVILLNWLFNGLILSIAYVVGMLCLVTDKHSFFYSPPGWVIYALGCGTVGLLILIGMSRLGQYGYRIFLGVRDTVGREHQRLNPLLHEVLEQSGNVKGTQYKLENLHLMVKDTLVVANAQAFGANTIMVTTGLLNSCTDDELKAILAHEVGHLHHNDGVILIAVIFGSFATKMVMWAYAVYAAFAGLFARIGGKSGHGGIQLMSLFAVIPLLIFLPVVILHWVGSKLLDLSLLLMSRKSEYRADQFVKDLGYLVGLISFLEKVQEATEHDNSLIGRIFASHPVPMKRIDRLERNVMR